MKSICAIALGSLLAAVGWAQSAAVPEVEQLPCLPQEGNAALEATATGVAAGDSVRVFFRRLHPDGAFYWVEMNPGGGDRHWAVLPKPEDRRQLPLTDDWWESLKQRDWLPDVGAAEDRPEALDEWLAGLENEAAEYFVAVYDSSGERRVRSRTFVAPVRRDCDRRLPRDPRGEPVELARRVGQAQNLAIGETSEMQYGRPVFHWLCDGVVTRVDTLLVMRPDDVCRACVVAWFPMIAPAGAIIGGAAINAREPRRVSRIQP